MGNFKLSSRANKERNRNGYMWVG